MTTPEPTAEVASKAKMAAELSYKLLRETHWIVIVDDGVHGASGGYLETSFRASCWEYSNITSYGAQVWEIDFATGTLRDVTAYAEAVIAAGRKGLR